jgi:hypothetical protein
LTIRKRDGKNIKDIIKVATKNLRTNDVGINKKHWFHDECYRAIMKHNDARKKMLQNTFPETTRNIGSERQ